MLVDVGVGMRMMMSSAMRTDMFVRMGEVLLLMLMLMLMMMMMLMMRKRKRNRWIKRTMCVQVRVVADAR